jgi:hypothetical protein
MDKKSKFQKCKTIDVEETVITRIPEFYIETQPNLRRVINLEGTW